MLAVRGSSAFLEQLEMAYFIVEIVSVHDADALAGVGELTYITTEEDWLASLDRLNGVKIKSGN
jgi:hypothetical protein